MSRRGTKSKKNAYEVQDIVDKRILNGKIEYKVLWKGYEEKDSTFEPLQNLTSIMDMVQQYEQRQKQKPKLSPSVHLAPAIKKPSTQTVQAAVPLDTFGVGNSISSKQKSKDYSEFPTKKRKNNDSVPTSATIANGEKVHKGKQVLKHSETKPSETISKTNQKSISNRDISKGVPRDSLNDSTMSKKKEKKPTTQKGILKPSLPVQSEKQSSKKDHNKVVSFPTQTSSQNELSVSSPRTSSKPNIGATPSKPPHKSSNIPQQESTIQQYVRINHHFIKNQKIMYQVQFNPMYSKIHIGQVQLDHVPNSSMKMICIYYEERLLGISQESKT